MATATSNLDLARNALRQSSHFVLRGLSVEQTGKTLVISGRVSSFYQKQMAQEAIRAVCDNVEVQIQNTVDVDR